jgi:hypothetical protein
MLKFTGWKYNGRFITEDGERPLLACVESKEESDRLSYLLTAAPALLAACQEMVGERPAHEWGPVYERARAAIAAACGPPQVEEGRDEYQSFNRESQKRMSEPLR